MIELICGMHASKAPTCRCHLFTHRGEPLYVREEYGDLLMVRGQRTKVSAGGQQVVHSLWVHIADELDDVAGEDELQQGVGCLRQLGQSIIEHVHCRQGVRLVGQDDHLGGQRGTVVKGLCMQEGRAGRSHAWVVGG